MRRIAYISSICILLISGAVGSAAAAPAPLDAFTFKERDGGGMVFTFTHTRPPQSMASAQTKSAPYQYTITFFNSRIAFQPYRNVPIEFPINRMGVKRIIFSERSDYTDVGARRVVEVVIESEGLFSVDDESQWNGQFLTVLIIPERQTATPAPTTMSQLKLFKEEQTAAARERMGELSRLQRQGQERSRSNDRLERMKQDSLQRVQEGKALEEAYKKLNQEAQTSTLPITRQTIGDRRVLAEVNVPESVRPVIRRPPGKTAVHSLQDCLLLATERYLPLSIALEQEKLAALRVREARRAFYPSFLAEWSETDGKTVTEPYRGRSYGFQAEQPLFTGGKLTAALRKEQLGELIARANVDKIKQDFFLNVGKAYYELVLARNAMDVTRRLRDRQRQWLGHIEQEAAIQSATPLELLNAQSVFNQANYQLATAEQEFALAKLRLEKELFLEGVDVSDIDYRFERRTLTSSLEECYELAFRSRPELQILEKTIEAAEYGEDIIRSERMPNIALVGNWGRSGEAFNVRDLTLAQQWSLMGRVRWFIGGNTLETSIKEDKVSPYRVTKTDTNLQSSVYNAKMAFWDNLANFTKQKEAVVTRQQAEKDLEEMRNKIRQETEEAYYNYRKHLAQLSLAMNELGYRRKQMEIILAKRAMAEAVIPEVMEAEQQLTQANITLQQSLAGLNLAMVMLNRAIGIINHFN